MSSSESETFPVPTLAPLTDDPQTAAEQLARLQTDLSDFPTAVDLVVAADQPQPIGRSWSFDWALHRFVKPARALSPQPTYGTETLLEWVEKAFHTAAGAHPVHPPGYGLAAPHGLMLGAPAGTIPPDLEDRIRAALTFHPSITDVTDFSYGFDGDDDFLAVSATIILDNNTAISLQNLRLTQSF